MNRRIRWMAAGLVVVVMGCGGSMTPAQRHEAARSSVENLRAGRFDEAEVGATSAIAKDKRNSEARAVRALVAYLRTSKRFYEEIVAGGRKAKFDPKHLHDTFESTEKDLASIDDDLAVAAKDESFSMELCLACWKMDWNLDGSVTARDETLFEIERDADGKPIPEDDPRRKPTFRFDIGDIHWARAMIAYQRAALDLVLAYRFDDIAHVRNGKSERMVVRLTDASRVKDARARILEGLEHSDHEREAYLAETDDDREWVPNPKQKNHPLPLPVDDELYDTWKEVLRDVRRLVESDEGIDVGELVRLLGEKKQQVHGYLNVGRLLDDPRDINLDVNELEKSKNDPDHILKLVFGNAYVKSMKPSPLPKRLVRMTKEIEHGDDTFARKLRYLFWLN